MPRYVLGELTRGDIAALAKEALLVLPVGAVEQHGPHLPTATDAILAENVVFGAARLIESDVPLVMAPTLEYGSSHHHLPYGATASIGSLRYYHVLTDLTETLLESGFRRIFVLNGHGGNHELIQLVARDIALKRQVWMAAGSYWLIAEQRLQDAGADRVGELPGHAGAFETSMMLAVRPELVAEAVPNRPPAPEYPVFGQTKFRLFGPGPFRAPDGFSDNPAAATAELGTEFLRACCESVAEAFRQFYESSERS